MAIVDRLKKYVWRNMKCLFLFTVVIGFVISGVTEVFSEEPEMPSGLLAKPNEN